jgi:cytochrome c5
MRNRIIAGAALGVMIFSGAAFGADGEAVYNQACMACHAQGVAGAPKLGDAEAWAPRIEKGIETLHDHSINGFQGEAGVMPPKGGFTNLSDEEVMAAVDYMVENSK